jgi:isoquinoline 1-oxidoreductase subunit alpha
MIAITVNGKALTTDYDDDTPLLWVIRDGLKMTGTKFGCGAGLCGACTVHLDGQPIRSCQTPLSAVVGKKISTIEAVHESKVGEAVQKAWQDLDVVQCGYCQSGQIMSATALLAKNSTPTDADIDNAMTGNICRCATYVRIRAAIHQAAKELV